MLRDASMTAKLFQKSDPTGDGMPVHPDHLVKISEQHKWPFNAIETLLAYGRGARVTEINIDTKVIDSVRCLVFSYNGVGMDKSQLHKMFSLGYCDKIESKKAHPIARHIGVGCMSGSLRLGKDMTVFTRNKNTAAIGFLSLTYLDAVKSDIVVVPLLEFSLSDYILLCQLYTCVWAV
ncbi:MORC CW-type zinc finger protein 3 [Bulinus truncatus]|nr:MORC CW-type zinc finger protein 3 [Bulinus truncatus]